MAFDLQEIKRIDNQTQCVVFGYARQCQSLFNDSDNSIFWNISELIIYTIIAFYAHFEYFEHYADNSFETEKQQTIIKRIGSRKRIGRDNAYRSVYGSKIISYDSLGIHTWIVKIIKGKFVHVGIDEASYKTNAFFYDETTKNYAYAGYNGTIISQHIQADHWGFHYSTGTRVRMVLNMNDKTLSFAVNHGAPNKAYDIERTDIGYCLAVFIRYTDDSMQILSYECTN